MKSKTKKIIIFIIAAIAVISITFAFLYNLIINKLASIKVYIAPTNSHTSISLVKSLLLSYNNAKNEVPYMLIHYSVNNVTNLMIYASMYIKQPPQTNKIYIFNDEGENYFSKNASRIEAMVENYLEKYGIINNPSQIVDVNASTVSSIVNNSILLVISGFMPQDLVKQNRSQSILISLLQKGTSIIYVGQNFNKLVTKGSVIIPGGNLPAFLSTVNFSGNVSSSDPLKDLFFSNATFSFTTGKIYGNVSYENVYNGSLIAFSNYPDLFNASSLAIGIAKSIAEFFWVPKYTEAEMSVHLASFNSSGNIGVLMQSPLISYGTSLNNSFVRIVAYSNPAYLPGKGYSYINYEPIFGSNGVLYIPGVVIPGYTFLANFTINQQANIGGTNLFLYIYNLNYTELNVSVLPWIPSVSNYTFIKIGTFNRPPGNYIWSLKNLYGYAYESALVTVPPINISMKSYNITNNVYTLYVSCGGQPLNLPFSITLNGNYSVNGIIKNGIISYNLPKGTPEIFGNLNFSLNVLSNNFTYTVYNPKFTINNLNQYIMVAIAIIITVILVSIKGPQRDDFYIDVPILPKPKTIPIKLKSADIVTVFDKQNQFYHWKYMPLSKEEVRTAIINNIRYNNLPVTATYQNIEDILDEMVHEGYLEELDGLYMPTDWVKKSGHDIIYLATFKKLRVWLILHAYPFTDLDASNVADIVATIKGEKSYFVIYSNTTKFKEIKIYNNNTTYFVFINRVEYDRFIEKFNNTFTPDAEKLRIFISSGLIKILDADNLDETFA
ncbi:MAG: hypothetical protein QXN16_01230 [Candidatus Micrarchaeaceae archaeon]